jgi:hypothetical protein
MYMAVLDTGVKGSLYSYIAFIKQFYSLLLDHISMFRYVIGQDLELLDLYLKEPRKVDAGT